MYILQVDSLSSDHWDGGSSWYRWAHQQDPISSIELDVVWDWRRLLPPGQSSSSSSSSSSSALTRQQVDSNSSSSSYVARHAPSGGPVSTIDNGQTSSQTSGQTSGQKFGQGPEAMTTEAAAAMLAAGGPPTADVWLLHVLERGYRSQGREGTLGMRAPERYRRHIGLARTGGEGLWSADLAERARVAGSLSGVYPIPKGHRQRQGAVADPPPGSLTIMLSALLTAYTAATAATAEGGSLHDLAGPTWWEARGELPPPAPPDSVMISVLRDLLQPQHPATAKQRGRYKDYTQLMKAGAGSSTPAGMVVAGSSSGRWYSAVGATASEGASAAISSSSSTTGQVQPDTNGSSSSSSSVLRLLPRAAPPGSLLGRLALHCGTFGNARAIAILWKRFIEAVRLQHWEERALLPRMPATAAVATGAQGSGVASSSSSTSGTSARLSGAGAATWEGLGGPPPPDLDACLLQQKLQMLNACIFRSGLRHARRTTSSSAMGMFSSSAAAAAGAAVGGAGSDHLHGLNGRVVGLGSGGGGDQPAGGLEGHTWNSAWVKPGGYMDWVEDGLGWDEKSRGGGVEPSVSSDFVSVGEEEEEGRDVGGLQSEPEGDEPGISTGLGSSDRCRESCGEGMGQEEQYKDCDEGLEQQQQEGEGEGQEEGGGDLSTSHQQQQQEGLGRVRETQTQSSPAAAADDRSSSNGSSSSSAATAVAAADDGSTCDDSSSVVVPVGVDEPWVGHYLIDCTDRVINTPQLQVRGSSRYNGGSAF